MKNKKIYVLIYILLITLILNTALNTAVYAKEKTYTVDELEEFIDGILSFNLKENKDNSVQEFIDGTLSKNSGTGEAEWYIIALKGYKNSYSYSNYISEINSYLSNGGSNLATDLLRIGLACSAANANREFINECIANYIGKSGIMSYIYGLLLMDSGNYESTDSERENIINTILDMRLSDGGWAVGGSYSDTDVTAMAIQALAPYCEEHDVKAAVDEAISLLGEKQQKDGDYPSWGTINCESTAQVIIALCAMKIDFQNDERFIKDGNTLIDGLLKYRLEDGSFSHTYGGSSNKIASVQAMCALTAAWRMYGGKSFLYDFENPDNITGQEESQNTAGKITQPPGNNEEDDKDGEDIKRGADFKIWIYLGIALILIISVAILLIRKKANLKNLLIALAAALLASVIVFFLNIQTKEEYYLVHIDDITPESETVFVSINCETVKGKKDFIPEDGIILEKTEYVLRDGDSAFDIILRAAKHNKIQIEYEGSAQNRNVYIEGINYIYEFDFGDLSGWVYMVNGETPNRGCSDYELSDGDIVEVVYTCSMGEDIISR